MQTSFPVVKSSTTEVAYRHFRSPEGKTLTRVCGRSLVSLVLVAMGKGCGDGSMHNENVAATEGVWRYLPVDPAK